MIHDEHCIDRRICDLMIDARDRVITDQAEEIAMLRARDGALETADRWIAAGARREKELLAEIAELRAALLAEREEWNQFSGVMRPLGSPPLTPKDARLLRAIFTPFEPEETGA